EATPPSYHLAEGGPAVDPQRLLAAACAVADRLAEQAIHGTSGDATWIGLALGRDEQWALLPLGMDLYDGLPGVALFLAYLGAAAGEEPYTVLARGALASMRRQLRPEKRRELGLGLGGFTGWGGILYALAHAGVLWQEPGLLAFAQELTAEIPALIDKD